MPADINLTPTITHASTGGYVVRFIWNYTPTQAENDTLGRIDWSIYLDDSGGPVADLSTVKNIVSNLSHHDFRYDQTKDYATDALVTGKVYEFYLIGKAFGSETIPGNDTRMLFAAVKILYRRIRVDLRGL